MSDPSSVLRTGLVEWLRDDTEVIAAFGSNTVQVLAKLPRDNIASPYVAIAGFFVDDASADCLRATEVDVQIDIWSLTTPPAFTQAETIGAAIRNALIRMEEDIGNSPEFSIAGYRVTAVQPTNTQYLTDIGDGKTVHGIVRATLSIDPV